MAINKDKREFDSNGKLVNKQCNTCFRMLSINNFYSNKAQYDGFSNCCKDCEKASISARLKNYKRNAKNRNLCFQLSKEEFIEITKKPCYYCGDFGFISPTNEKYNGIDRIDSQKGYEKNNVVPCCSNCNKMKLDLSQNDFLYHIQKIYEFQNWGGN